MSFQQPDYQLTLPPVVKKKARANQHTLFLIQLIFVYVLSWIVVSNNMGLPFRFAILALLLIVGTRSYQKCAIIFLLCLFIPFYKNLIGVAGIDPSRLLFFPFVYLSVTRPKLREFPVNRLLISLVVLAVISIKISADIMSFVQEIPLSLGQAKPRGIENLIASNLDILIIFYFLYSVFTRSTLFEIKRFLDILLIFSCFQAATLLTIVYEHPEVVFDHTSRSEDFKSHLWTNPHFGHKNDWAMLMAFVVLYSFTKISSTQQSRMLYYTVILLALVTVVVSLSRQAYVWVAFGMILLALQMRNRKLLIACVLVAILVAITRPEFMMERMDSMINARSMDDFQELNRKVSSLAKDQFIQNLTFIPRMFFSEWEYNFSEGFWNGMLHQQGLMGLAFHLFVFLFMFLRYLRFYKSNNSKLSIYGAFATLLVFLMFFACINRRTTYFIHYKGNFNQINILLLLIFTHVEIVYYAAKNRLRNIKYL